MFAQAFYTLAFMHGGMGTPGNYASWVGLHEGMSLAPYCMAGDSSDAFKKNPANPLTPKSLSSVPLWSEMEDPTAWEKVDYSECWQSILDGEYGRDTCLAASISSTFMSSMLAATRTRSILFRT